MIAEQYGMIMPEQDFVDSVHTFAQNKLAVAAAQIDQGAEFPEGHWAQLAEFGLTGLIIPPEYGGLGVNRSTFTAILQETAGACAVTTWALLAHSAAAAGLTALDSEVQRTRYLLDLAHGTLRGAFAVTETGGGSNPGAIRTVAQADADGYVLNGGKFFISQAGVADLYLVLARTQPRMSSSRVLSTVQML